MCVCVATSYRAPPGAAIHCCPGGMAASAQLRVPLQQAVAKHEQLLEQVDKMASNHLDFLQQYLENSDAGAAPERKEMV